MIRLQRMNGKNGVIFMVAKLKVLSLLLLLLLVGCEGIINETNDDGRIEAGTFILEVVDVYEGSDQLFDETPDGQRRLLIDVLLENTSETARSISALLMFELERPDGTKVGVELFDPNYVSPDGSLAAGAIRQATLVFFVPETENAWSLWFSPDTFSPGRVQVTIRLDEK